MSTLEKTFHEHIEALEKDLDWTKEKITDLKLTKSARALTAEEKATHKELFDLLISISTNINRVKYRFFAPSGYYDNLLGTLHDQTK